MFGALLALKTQQLPTGAVIVGSPLDLLYGAILGWFAGALLGWLVAYHPWRS
jgi:hypothetical protein